MWRVRTKVERAPLARRVLQHERVDRHCPLGQRAVRAAVAAGQLLRLRLELRRQGGVASDRGAEGCAAAVVRSDVAEQRRERRRLLPEHLIAVPCDSQRQQTVSGVSLSDPAVQS